MPNLKVTSPYNKQFVDRARQIGGTWDKARKAWFFPADAEAAVRDALTAAYGTDGEAGTVRVRLTVRAMTRGQMRNEIEIGGVVVARRWDRDEQVKVANGARVVSGSFRAKGKSRAYPGTDIDGEAVVIEVGGIPADAAQDAEGVEILGADESDSPVRVERVATDEEARPEYAEQFAQARAEGQPVLIEETDESAYAHKYWKGGEYETAIVARYAMPDGSIKTDGRPLDYEL